MTSLAQPEAMEHSSHVHAPLSLEEGVGALHVAGRHARRLRGLRQRRLELDETTVLVTLLRVGRPEVTA